jgi:uncharacterized protein
MREGQHQMRRPPRVSRSSAATASRGGRPAELTVENDRRLQSVDWTRLGESLDERGYATIPALLTPGECADLAAMYDDRQHFRSRIVMERLRFGVGEYKYFAYPLPPIVAALRAAIYSHLAPIANRWAHAMGQPQSYPANLTEFLERCTQAGQTKPTPLLLRYQEGGYNCLHQDLYGEVAFPVQLTCLLSRPGTEFSGGEFLLVENRPRAQSRGEAVVLQQGEAIVFATNERPISGSRGYYRVAMRHGISRLHRGRRVSLGVIFHDAK